MGCGSSAPADEGVTLQAGVPAPPQAPAKGAEPEPIVAADISMDLQGAEDTLPSGSCSRGSSATSSAIANERPGGTGGAKKPRPASILLNAGAEQAAVTAAKSKPRRASQDVGLLAPSAPAKSEQPAPRTKRSGSVDARSSPAGLAPSGLPDPEENVPANVAAHPGRRKKSMQLGMQMAQQEAEAQAGEGKPTGEQRPASVPGSAPRKRASVDLNAVATAAASGGQQAKDGKRRNFAPNPDGASHPTLEKASTNLPAAAARKRAGSVACVGSPREAMSGSDGDSPGMQKSARRRAASVQFNAQGRSVLPDHVTASGRELEAIGRRKKADVDLSAPASTHGAMQAAGLLDTQGFTMPGAL